MLHKAGKWETFPQRNHPVTSNEQYMNGPEMTAENFRKSLNTM